MTDETAQELAERVRQVLTRYCRQNGGDDGLAAEITTVAARLAEIARWRAAESPDATGPGEPPEMEAAAVGGLVTRVLDGLSEAGRLAGPVKQLVKGCFQATRRKCRESYREVDAAGVCRRQLRAKARERVSGTHCVDCPYWVQLTPEQHEQLLARAWIGGGGAAELAAGRAVFLPEDFRALRRLARA